MTGQWVVVARGGEGDHDVTGVWGPISDGAEALRFAAYMTTEVDPAEARQLMSPLDAVLHFHERQRSADPWSSNRPELWPPQPGTVWQDRNGKRWIGQAKTGYLVCIADLADDNAEEIWRHHGPLKFIQIISPTEEEPPF